MVLFVKPGPVIVLGIVLATGLAGGPGSGNAWQAFAAQKPGPARLELDKIKQQLDQARKRENDIIGQLSALEAEAEQISARLIALAARIKSREALIAAGEQRIVSLNGRERRLLALLSARRDTLGELLAGLQRLEQNPPPPLVAHPDDAVAAIRGAMLFGAIVPALQQQAAALSQALARLNNVRAKQKREQLALAAHVAKLRTSQSELSALHTRKAALVSTSQARLEAERTRAAGLARKAKSLNQLLSTLASEAKKAQKQAKSRADAKKRLRTALLNRPKIAFTRMAGRLEFPAQGHKLRKFGDKNGFGGRSKGLFLATLKGAQVTAPANGQIEFAGEFRSYGQLLIINVGEGYHVLLAGLATISGRPGQYVRAGEPVGIMGTAPARGTLIGDLVEESRPVLYIEFRKKGSAIDSARWWIGSNKKARG